MLVFADGCALSRSISPTSEPPVTTMKLRSILPLLVIVLLVPVAAAYATPSDGEANTAPSISSDVLGSSTTSTETSPSNTAAGSDSESNDEWNYTKLYVDGEHSRVELKPGEHDEFTITVKNNEDEIVEVNPHVYVPPVGEHLIQPSWMSIDGPTRIDAGEEVEFTVTVTVPTDAELGYYSGQIAFTDETISYPGRPARPVHAEHVRVEVWKEPTVEIQTRTYLHGKVKAGESITHEIEIKNTGNNPVPVSPELQNERRHCSGNCPAQFDAAWLDIEAPNQIAPGETATVSVTVSPTESADRGRYRAQIDLGLKDPNRDERRNYWQMVRLNLEVWKQPAEPFKTTFEVSERTEEITLTLSPRSMPYYRSTVTEKPEPVSFDVEFVNPNGKVIDGNRVKVTDNGFVDLSGEAAQAMDEQDYVVREGGKEFVYRADNPEAGTWHVRIMPHNTIGYQYQIERNESDP